MKAATILIVGLAAGALAGCSYMHRMVDSSPGNTVEFVAGNDSSILIDFNNDSPGELKYADAMAKDKCMLFSKSSATLESLNPRGDADVMRATYLCH